MCNNAWVQSFKLFNIYLYVTLLCWCLLRWSTWYGNMAPSVGQLLQSTFREGLENSVGKGGTTTWTRRWRSLRGPRRKIESSMKLTNALATAGRRSLSFSPDGNGKSHLCVQSGRWNQYAYEYITSPQQDGQLHQEPLEFYHEEEGGAWGLPARRLQDFQLSQRCEGTSQQAMSSDSSGATAPKPQSSACDGIQPGPCLISSSHILNVSACYLHEF